MFRGEREERLYGPALGRSEPGDVAEEDTQAELVALGAPKGARAVPSETGLRVGAGERRRVRRGDPQAHGCSRMPNRVVDESSGTSERIDVNEIEGPTLDRVGEGALEHHTAHAVVTEVRPHKVAGRREDVAEHGVPDVGLEEHSDAPSTGRRESIEDLSKVPGPSR